MIGSVARVLLALILLRGSVSQAITVCRTLVAVWERLPLILPPLLPCLLPITLLLALLLPPPPPSVLPLVRVRRWCRVGVVVGCGRWLPGR